MDAPHTTTLGRWVVPSTVLSLAVLAICVLVSFELREAGLLGGGPEEPQGRALTHASRAGTEVVAPGQRRRRELTLQAPGQAGPGKAARATVNTWGSSTHSDVIYDPSADNSTDMSLLQQLAHGADLRDRLVILDDCLAGLDAEGRVVELMTLVDSVLPGTFEEGEQLRLGVISRLGRYASFKVDSALLKRIRDGVPRPQRLLAIELLAPREGAQGAIAALADHDRDVVVREKARWALQRGR